MRIGIDASRAFVSERTGIEEYSFQVIKHLCEPLTNEEVVLYVKRKQRLAPNDLPKKWRVKVILWPRLWTQGGLSLEMFFHPVDVLFVPAHTIPFIHIKKTIVIVHGLEFERCPKAYSLWERIYMRWSIRLSCRWAQTIIAVSENTKKDLRDLYHVPKEKIAVIYEGIGENIKYQITKNKQSQDLEHKISKPYVLFIGRIEERKNIIGIIEAFEILKEKYAVPHQLVLAGKPGFGHDKVNFKIQNSKFKNDIREIGFVSEEEKTQLFKDADIFLFPTLYEGFGLPILEAQSMGVPVVASNNSSIPEVAGEGALLVHPNDSEEIAKAVHRILSDENCKRDIIKKGQENVKRFSWEKCAHAIASLLRG